MENNSHSHSYAIVRSAEFLSCARTALRIAQQQVQQKSKLDEGYIDDTAGNSNKFNISNDNSKKKELELSLLSRKAADLHLYQEIEISSDDNDGNHINNPAYEALKDASLTLSLLDSTLSNLSKLVKRRGHTNDPSAEISQCMSQVHSYAKDIMHLLQNTLLQSATLPFQTHAITTNSHSNSTDDSRCWIKSSSQRIKHYQTIASTLQSRVEALMKRFQDIMAVRGDVIKDLTLRRKRLLNTNNNTSSETSDSTTTSAITNNNINSNNNNTITNTATYHTHNNIHGNHSHPTYIPPPPKKSQIKSQLQSPLFTASHQSNLNNTASNIGTKKTPPFPKNQPTNTTITYGSASYTSNNNNKTMNRPQGYGGYAGYGQSNYEFANTNASSSTTGMRRRVGAGSTTNTSNNTYNNQNNYNPYNEATNESNQSNTSLLQTEIQIRRQNRQTQTRLESARQAEKSLAELTSMFSKMSTLITSQGETLTKIEDDVEAAMDHVVAGGDEIDKVYEWTKGNRSLIVKVFGIVIFFIVFMRWY